MNDCEFMLCLIDTLFAAQRIVFKVEGIQRMSSRILIRKFFDQLVNYFLMRN